MNEVDLTPINPSDLHDRVRPLRSLRNWTLGLIVIAAISTVLYFGLSNASLYFLNVDEAIAQRDELGDDEFRLQGVMIHRASSDRYLFVLEHGGEHAVVDHVGVEPSDLFECGQNIVAQGRWVGEKFQSSQLLVKHSEDYKQENASRLESAAPSNPGGGCVGVGALDPQTLVVVSSS